MQRFLVLVLVLLLVLATLGLGACSAADDAPRSFGASAVVAAPVDSRGPLLFACTHEKDPSRDYRLRFDESSARLTYEHGATQRTGPLFGRPLDTVGPDTMLFYTPAAFFILRQRTALTAVLLGDDSVRRDERSDCDAGDDGSVLFDEELFARMKERAALAFERRTAFGVACRATTPDVTVFGGTVLSILPGLDGKSVQLFGSVVDRGAYDITTFTVDSVKTEPSQTILRGSGWAKLRPEDPAAGPQLDARVDELAVGRDDAGSFLRFPGRPAEPFASIRCERFDIEAVGALLGGGARP